MKTSEVVAVLEVLLDIVGVEAIILMTLMIEVQAEEAAPKIERFLSPKQEPLLQW